MTSLTTSGGSSVVRGPETHLALPFPEAKLMDADQIWKQAYTHLS